MKKVLIILGFTALLAIFWASPASAQTPGTVTADDIVASGPSSVDVTLNGSGWSNDALYWSACPGALGDASGINAGTAVALCPTISAVIFASNLTASEGSFSETVSLDIRQEDIDAGSIVITFGEEMDLSGLSGFRLTIPISSGGGGDTATTTAPAPAEPLATTGVESSLLIIIGASVIFAGLLFAGLGRRLRRN